MVSCRRIGALLVASPGWIVAVRKFFSRSISISIVTRGEYGSGYIVEQAGCYFVAIVGAMRDVACANQDGIIFRQGRDGGRDRWPNGRRTNSRRWGRYLNRRDATHQQKTNQD